MLSLSPEASESASLAVDFIFATRSGPGRPSAVRRQRCLSEETLGRARIWASCAFSIRSSKNRARRLALLSQLSYPRSQGGG